MFIKVVDGTVAILKFREVGNVIQKHASTGGYSVVRSYCGHGIHKLFHCAPNVPHYAKNKVSILFQFCIVIILPSSVLNISPATSEPQITLFNLWLRI